MKRVSILLLLIMAVTASHAQLLWKVSGGNTWKPSYLFGTIHLETSQYIDSVPGLTDALTSVDAVYGEVLGESLTGNDTMMKMMKNLVAPPDSTIDRLLSPAEYHLVDSVVKDYLMGLLGLDQLKKFKPIVVTTQLEVLQMSRHFPNFMGASDGIDIALQARAASMGKHIDGLETVDSQIQALMNAPLTEQAQDLVEMCRKDKEFAVFNKRLCDAYHAQDLTAITNIVFDPDMGMDDEEMERLSYARNRQWMDKITMTLPVQSVLVVVGAAHLVGPEGLIELLRDRGYVVEPVVAQ